MIYAIGLCVCVSLSSHCVRFHRDVSPGDRIYIAPSIHTYYSASEKQKDVYMLLTNYV